RRAWPPPPNVQSTATSPGCGSSRSISSPASTGMCVCVMSSSVAKTRCNVGGTDQDVLAVAAVPGAVEYLQALARTDHLDLLVKPGVIHQLRRDHHPVGRVELGVVGEVEEEPLEVPRPRRQRA